MTPDNGWETWKIGHAYQEIGSGTTPNTSNTAYFNGTMPWLNTGDLTDGVVSHVSRSVTDQALAEHSALRVYETGSLGARSSYLGSGAKGPVQALMARVCDQGPYAVGA